MLETIDQGAVRELRMTRPPANALDPGLVGALRAAVEHASADGAGALVLSAAGRLYSGGLDVPVLLSLDRAAMSAFLGDFLALLRALATSEIPVVAAITGHAPAGGAVLAIQCDHRVMADGDFKIGLNEVQVGIPLPRVLHSVLARVVGVRQAERLGTRGLLVSAGEALAIGLVDELVAPELVIERAHEVARDYLALPPVAMRRTRALARSALREIYAQEERATWEAFVDDWFAPETQGVLSALVEKLKQRN